MLQRLDTVIPWNCSNAVSSSLKSKFFAGQSPVETTVNKSAAVGSSFTQACAYGNKLYAKVYDPKGRLISEGPNAQIKIPFVRVEDNGTWLCLVQMSDRLFQLPVFVNLNGNSHISLCILVMVITKQGRCKSATKKHLTEYIYIFKYPTNFL